MEFEIRSFSNSNVPYSRLQCSSFPITMFRIPDHNSKVEVLSAFNGKILACSRYPSQFIIYSQTGDQLSTIAANDISQLCDAIWTPRGNILYTTYCNKVTVISENGQVIAQNKMQSPMCLSVFNGNIYLADWNIGAFQSTDDGVNWSLVFSSPNEWNCWQVIKVEAAHNNNFWTLSVYRQTDNFNLRIYNVNNNGDVTWKDISPPTIDNKEINMNKSSLTYDGKTNIFLSNWYDKCIHVLSLDGQSHHQILSQLTHKPCKVAVDEKGGLLYVGENDGIVEVFEWEQTMM